MPDNTIEIWTYPASTDSEARSALPPLARQRPEVTHADPAQLAQKLRSVIAAFEQAIDDSPSIKRSLEIDTIELKLGVSASGGIALIGKLDVGVDAGITVTLRRSRPAGSAT